MLNLKGQISVLVNILDKASQKKILDKENSDLNLGTSEMKPNLVIFCFVLDFVIKFNEMTKSIY